MNRSEYLNRYAEGWTRGDATTIVAATDDAYSFDDPNAGSISRAGFSDYLAALKRQAEAIRGGPSGTFMDLTEVVTQDEEGVLTAWCWWSIPGTPIEGSGLIKVGDGGVLSERIAYYTRLPA